MNGKLSLFWVVIVLLLAPSPAGASNSWQVRIDSSRLAHYLDYPSSSLKSIIKLSVDYQHGDESVWSQYETLYYNNNLSIGCNKHGPLEVALGAGGTIKVTSNTDSAMLPDECDAVANATGRLFLDLYLKRCAVYDVIVPAISFDSMLEGFQRNGFHPKQQGNGGPIVLNMVSDPPGRFQPLVF